VEGCGPAQSNVTVVMSNEATPSIDSESHLGPSPSRDRLAVFEDQIARVRSGALSPYEFGTWLEEMAAQMAERQKQLQEIYSSLPPELEGAFGDEARVGFEGVSFYLTGVEHLRAYVLAPNEALLDRALDAMHEGNRLIIEAMQINRDNREADDEPSPLDEPLDDVEDDTL